MSMTISEFLLQRYPNIGRLPAIRRVLEDACNAFIESGLADRNFVNELCSGSEQKFWSRVSEALLVARIRESGLDPLPTHGRGPDFLLSDDNRKIWIEVVCPEPIGVPADWLMPEHNAVADFPHGAILLRWTSAIKEKAEKLIGSMDGTIKGYIEKKIVASEDAYVIAVNGRQLRNGPGSALTGISQFPFAVEAVFAVGPYQISINRDTLEQTGAGHQHRPQITNIRGASVPTYTFLDPRFRPISAIWAVDVDGTSVIGNSEPMAVIHNPNALNPIPVGFLPAYDEYVATPTSADEYELNTFSGRLGS